MSEEWLIPCAMISLSALIALAHGFCLLRYLLRRKPFSVVPLVGGIAGTAGLLMAPAPSFSQLWWIPLLLDYGSAPSLVVWIRALSRKWCSPQPPRQRDLDSGCR
jgi:hypothetical protein